MQGEEGFSYTITVSGTGEFNVIPNEAVINVGVTTEDAESERAVQINNKIMNQVDGELRSLGIPPKDILSTNYSVQPIYKYIDETNILTGYKVTHLIQVTLKEISKLGAVIDRVTAVGANEIGNIQFSFSDKEWAQQESLKLALQNAIEKASALANTLGLQIQRVPIKIVEEGNSSYLGAAKMMAAVPIMPGELKYVATVRGIFLIIC